MPSYPVPFISPSISSSTPISLLQSGHFLSNFPTKNLCLFLCFLYVLHSAHNALLTLFFLQLPVYFYHLGPPIIIFQCLIYKRKGEDQISYYLSLDFSLNDSSSRATTPNIKWIYVCVHYERRSGQLSPRIAVPSVWVTGGRSRTL